MICVIESHVTNVYCLCCIAGATEDAINAAREAFHRHLAATQKGQQHIQDTSEEDLSQFDERELDAEFAGQSLFSHILFVSPWLYCAIILMDEGHFVVLTSFSCP